MNEIMMPASKNCRNHVYRCYQQQHNECQASKQAFKMALLIKKMIKAYHYLNTDLSDPRAASLPLMSSPFPLFAILCGYLYFVLRLGPRFMKHRKPYKIEKIIIVFNILQIIVCGHIVIEFFKTCFYQFNWFCEPIDYSTNPVAMKQMFYSWIYFMLKVLDLLDTVFFVLRKKYNQITFLHLYHHTGMALMTWVGAKYIAGGHGLFIGFANCIVHTFMYLYYLMSIWNEKYKKSIWWKKYITQLQIAQFLFLVVMFSEIIIQPECTYPKWVAYGFLPQNFFMLVMFSDFYWKAYIKKKPQHNGKQSHIPKTVPKNTTINNKTD